MSAQVPPAESATGRDFDYRATQDKLATMVGLVIQMFDDGELESMLAHIDRSETLGPIFNPTLFRQGMDQLRVVKRDAVAMRRLRDDLKERHTAEVVS